LNFGWRADRVEEVTQELSLMPCPFPGMDPFLEKQPYWGDFTPGFIKLQAHRLLEQLLPRYEVCVEEYLYVVRSTPGLPGATPGTRLLLPGRRVDAVPEPRNRNRLQVAIWNEANRDRLEGPGRYVRCLRNADPLPPLAKRREAEHEETTGDGGNEHEPGEVRIRCA
jgi:hypothetical protein